MAGDAGSTGKAIVLIDEAAATLKSGGITLLERWEKGLGGLGVACEPVGPGGLGPALASANGPILLAYGDFVVETLAMEPLVEALAGCGPDEVVSLSAPGLLPAPAVCIGVGVARRILEGRIEPGEDASHLLPRLSALPGVSVKTLSLAEAWWGRVRSAEDGKAATWALLGRLQWRPGGVVAKYLNRPLSIRMSRYLVDTPVTPNQTTWFAFFVGLVGIFLVFKGGYWLTLLGAFLLQANSVIDGIDGELARLRHQTSDYGAYLDSVCDEILNSLLFIGMGYNLMTGGHHPAWFYAGIFSGVMAFAYALVHWHCKWKHGLGFYWWFEAYKPRKEVQRSTSLLSYFKKLFWKESYLLIFLLLAAANFFQPLLAISVVAAAVIVVFFIIHIPIKRARW
jgi:phosphatidylglycerophosphate synthase